MPYIVAKPAEGRLDLAQLLSRLLLEQSQSVLELRDAELELGVLVACDEAELLEHGLQARAGALTESRRLAAPAGGLIVDHAARLFPCHASAPRELFREL